MVMNNVCVQLVYTHVNENINMTEIGKWEI